MAWLDSDPRFLPDIYSTVTTRIVVVDSISQPGFKASALAPWLEIKQVYVAEWSQNTDLRTQYDHSDDRIERRHFVCNATEQP